MSKSLNIPDDYSESEVNEVIEELDKAVVADRDTIIEKVEKLAKYRIQVDDIEKVVRDELPETYAGVDIYDRFSDWDGELPPPHIEPGDWVDYDETTSKSDIYDIAMDLDIRDGYVVYCVQCELDGSSVRSVERKANKLFGEIPAWVKDAYTADNIFYIGVTHDLRKRFQAHATGIMSDYIPPARLTRLSENIAVGVAFRTLSQEDGEMLEEMYGDNFQEVVEDDDSTFVYYA